jgi:NAD dependent epimerase/dehydratase family enzyme
MGGWFGSGKQAMSWIAMDDWLGAFYHAVLDQRCGGPVNTVAPEVVTNAEFAACLARVLRKPSVMAVPAWGLRLALGRMAEETLLSGARVEPGRLDEARYEFRFPKLEEALRHLLGR